MAILFIEFHATYTGIVKILRKSSRQCQALIDKFACFCCHRFMSSILSQHQPWENLSEAKAESSIILLTTLDGQITNAYNII